MIRVRLPGSLLLLTVGVAVAGCQLKRPETIPSRMIEPQLLDAQPPEQATIRRDAAPLRLLDTQARGHIGRRVLHQQSNGELTEDPVWRWSSTPDRYLDMAMRMELAASARLQLVDAANVPSLAMTLVVWHVESAAETRLVGAVEFTYTQTDRVVRTHVVRVSEALSSSEPPGDLAAAAGRLLHRIARDGLAFVVREP